MGPFSPLQWLQVRVEGETARDSQLEEGIHV